MIIDPANRLQHIQEYYFSKKLREIKQLIAQGHDIINLGIGSPDLDPPLAVVEALRRASTMSKSAQYQGYKGITELRRAIADWYQDMYQVQLNPDQEILPLLGSKEGIMHVSMSFLQSGDEVLVPNPGYPTYRAASLLAGAKVLEYRLSAESNWLPDLDFLRKFSLRRVKLLWLSTPHMPTGATMDLQQLQEVVDFAGEENILLCHDNPYSFILNQKPLSIFQAIGAKEVAIELNSLSKTYNMAGFRVGMLLGAPDYVATVMKFKTNMDSGMYLPIQKAAIAAMKTPKPWLNNVRKVYTSRRKLAWKLLDNLGCTYNEQSAGMFVWAKIADGEASGISLSEKLLDKAKVFITPGTVFGSQGERYVRVSLTNSEEDFWEAIERSRRL